MLHRYAEAMERFKHLGGYEIDARVADVLKGLGFTLDDQSRKTEEFSGGWQMRIALAKLLLARPNLLLMDEPTNHLDLPARNWLEEYLDEYPGSVVLVSHDRYFLDATVKRITEVGLHTLTDYHGNYSKYVVEHAAAMERLREAHRRQKEEIDKVSAFINRFRYQATKARQVQSRIKALDKVELIEIPPERKKIHFDFPGRGQERPRGARAEAAAARRTASNVVFDDLSLTRARRPRGPGRAERRGQVDADAHGRRRGPSGRRRADCRPQRGHRLLRAGPGRGAQPHAHGLRGDDVGQRDHDGADDPQHPGRLPVLGRRRLQARCACCRAASATASPWPRCSCSPSNVLLLDEPTNHLDLDSKEVLLEALDDYGGTLIFVSHDRYFVDRLATKIIEIGRGTAVVYPGTYKEFLWHKGTSAGIAGCGSERRDGRTAGRQNAGRDG